MFLGICLFDLCMNCSNLVLFVDIVAMSRTGSGKTAAFVIPILQKLKTRDMKGIRGLIIEPTRELAMQTFTVVKEVDIFF